MNSFIITPKTSHQADLLSHFLTDAGMNAKIITDEEKEDVGLLLLMSEVDRNDTVSEEEVLKALAQ